MGYLQLLSILLVLAAYVCAGQDKIGRAIRGELSIAKPENVQRPAFASPKSATDDTKLIDIALLATIDGRFHAVNRTTGDMIWSVPLASSTNDSDGILHHLIRTEHPRGPGADGTHELYIVEPQTGDIFVLAEDERNDEPLRRLPYSVPKLVDHSPFKITDPPRTFVGLKETSIITLDLDTGAILGSTKTAPKKGSKSNNSQSNDYAEEEDDDDELEYVWRRKRREIHIGRTDYQVQVLSGNAILQNLAFTVYGPNNIDRDRQARWAHTPDGLYIQPGWNGEVLGIKTQNQDQNWALHFKTPVVAIFDVVASTSNSQPFALLQPRPKIEDIFPTDHQNTDQSRERTLVGRIGNSLYAMGSTQYPVLSFAVPKLLLDSPLDGDEKRKCRGLDCYTGIRIVNGDGEHSRLTRLLDESKEKVNANLYKRTPEQDALRIARPSTTGLTPPADPRTTRQTAKLLADNNFLIQTHNSPSLGWSVILPFVGGIVAIWLLLRKFMKLSDGNPTTEDRVRPQRNSSAEERNRTNPFRDSRAFSLPVSSTERPVASTSRTILEELPSMSEKCLDDVIQPSVIEVLTHPTQPVQMVSKPGAVDDSAKEEEEEADGDGDGDKGGKRKRARRKRGKKINKGNPQNAEPEDDQPELEKPAISSPSKEQTDPPNLPAQAPSASLIVTSKVLGFGSHGTMVFEGSLQGRAVAVKRLLQDFVTVASREVAILQESDDHPNVIRYFYQERKENFLYIALELCPASLADIIERPAAFKEIVGAFEPKRALQQVTSGLRHLHSLKIIHRDIKPQNILVSKPKNGQHRMLISDFGLCKKLELDQTSFLPTMAVGSSGGLLAAGTVGWRAPEILRGEVTLDEAAIEAGGSGSGTNPSIGGSNGAGTTLGSTRLTKSVDIFALGCLFYYTLTNGDHPYGDRFSREANILKGSHCLGGLEALGEEGVEAVDLIESMLMQEPSLRPDTYRCLLHPFFWTPNRRLTFLQDASDRFEIMERDPREAGLIALEKDALQVVGPDWHKRLDRIFIDNLGKYRKYDGASVQDLLRALRNKKHHYQDLPDNVKRHLGTLPEGFLNYFTRRFPSLFLHVYSVVSNLPIRYEPMFKIYFTLEQ